MGLVQGEEMIGEEIKDALKELTLEELRNITWDYSKVAVIGLYNGNIIRGFLFNVTECGEVNPLTVVKCNVAAGRLKHLDGEFQKAENMCSVYENVKRDQEGNLKYIDVSCRVVVDLLTNEGNVIVTLD